MDDVTGPAPLAAGLWCVLATPFDAALQVDVESLRRQVELSLRAGADGLTVLGVFGEAAALDTAEQQLVLRTVAECAPGVPLVVGLSARTTAVVLEQAGALAPVAGDALAGLMVQAHSADRATLVAHLDAVHAHTGAGVVLQDYPLVSGIRLSAAQVLDVVGECPFVVAVKAESPPTPPAIAALTAGTGVPVFGGLGGVGLVDELACGAAGAMTGFSHPEGLRATLDAWREGGFAAARQAWAPWLPLANFEGQAGIGLALRKQLLHRRGVLACPAVRPPAPGAPPALDALLDAHLNAVATALPAAR